MLRRIWNGPFSLGPLNQEPSFTQLTTKLLELVWKGGLVILIVLAIAYGVQRVRDSLEQAERDRIIQETEELRRQRNEQRTEELRRLREME